MGLTTKGRIMFNRRRFNIRKIISIRNMIILVLCFVVIFSVSSIITANALRKKVANSTVVYKADETTGNITQEEQINNEEPTVKTSTTNNVEDVNDNQNINIDSLSETVDKGMTINLLGEVMMGGVVSEKLNYSYSSAIKGVYSTTRSADFTYCNFPTNITNLDKIENVKSKYLVTNEAITALEALGVDSVSIASDHIIDYPTDIIKNTISKFEEADIFVAGRENMPVYFEKDGKKIAIVSTNSVIIGTSKNYSNEGISIYSKDNLSKNIQEAKESADVVIADIHWGRDHVYGVTNQMKDIARAAIDAGADMVIGSHALGVYPIVKYNDKPIIYSTGYLMSDLDYNVAKEGFIFKVNIDENMKINTLEMTPIFIENKEAVKLYNEYDLEKCSSYLQQFNNWHLENGLDSKIEDDKIVINF